MSPGFVVLTNRISEIIVKMEVSAILIFVNKGGCNENRASHT